MNNSSNYQQLKCNHRQIDYNVTETIHQEKKHIIVPVIMIVEGVLNGSHGPLLHLAEEFGKIPESWNGIPVVINHPESNGIPISANSPGVIDSSTVGRVYNVYIEDNKLKGECWIDPEKLASVSQETLDAITKNEAIEVSVGVFTEDESVEGDYNGQKYNAIARNHRPDHLALLPDGVGACSLEDGCGIRANQKKGGQQKLNDVERRQAMLSLNELGFVVNGIVDNSKEGLREKLDQLRTLVNALDTNNPTSNIFHYYLEEAYDDKVIYVEYSPDGEKYYQQNYQSNEGKLELTGDPIEVRKKIEYVKVNANGFIRTNFKNKQMADEKCTPCVKKKVGELIANKATKWTEANREYLETLEESTLDLMMPEAVETPAPVVNQLTLNEEDQAALDYGKKMMKQRRESLVQGIQANTSKELWPDVVLNTMNEETLERIFNSVKKEEPADYSMGGAGRVPNNNRGKVVTPLYPAGVEIK